MICACPLGANLAVAGLLTAITRSLDYDLRLDATAVAQLRQTNWDAWFLAALGRRRKPGFR